MNNLLSSPALQLLHPALSCDEQTPEIYHSHVPVTPGCILYMKEEKKPNTLKLYKLWTKRMQALLTTNFKGTAHIYTEKLENRLASKVAVKCK